VSDQEATTPESNSDLRSSLTSLLAENLSDQDLRDRLRALVGTSDDTAVQPTTDDATDHPGYQ
jgi:hypothetical protein